MEPETLHQMYAKNLAQGLGSPNPSSGESPVSGTQAGGTEPPTDGQNKPTEGNGAVHLESLFEDQSDKQQDQRPFELKLPADTVVGETPDGKPITLADLESGYLRHEDYTRKTQEIQETVSLFKELEPYYKAITEGSDEEALGAVLEILDQRGLGDRLAELFAGAQGSAPQGVAGQPAAPYANSSGSYSTIDLSAFAEGTPEYELAKRYNELVQMNSGFASELERVNSQFVQLVEAIERSAAQEQAKRKINEIASNWQSKGFSNIAVDKAYELIGQPITPEQAMFLAHMEDLIRHQAAYLVSKNMVPKPNEPGALSSRNGVRPDELSFRDFARSVQSNF